MREIKFRVWTPKKKGGDMEEYPEMTEWDVSDNIDFMQQLAKGGVILQYTGVKDKNGKEIYEGDVCNVEYYNHSAPNTFIKQVVLYEFGTFALKSENAFKLSLKLEDTRQYVPLYYALAPNKIEVMGNIYENPELLDK